MIDRVARNYAGYGEKARGRGAPSAAVTGQLQAAARATPTARERTAVLREWLALFADRHLSVRHVDSAAPEGEQPGAEASTPALTFPTSSHAYLRVPSFELVCGVARRALLRAAHARLVTTATLIIDIRGNGGGGDAASAPLLPLLYTRPVRVIGTDIWASADNAAYLRTLLGLAELSDHVKTGLRAVVTQMERHPDHFVPLSGDAVIRLPCVYPHPRRIAVLFDRRTASAAEEFLLRARQSDKVTLFARSHSAGVLDYSNVNTALLPSGEIELGTPISRSRRLSTLAVDGVGIAPDVRIPDDVDDEAAYVRDYLDRHATSRVTDDVAVEPEPCRDAVNQPPPAKIPLNVSSNAETLTLAAAGRRSRR